MNLNGYFIYAWWAALVIAIYVFPGHECRGAALGFILGVLPVDYIARMWLGIHSSLWVLVIGMLIASIPVLWGGWVWARCSAGLVAKAILIIGSLVMATVGYLYRYWDFDSFVSGLTCVVPDGYEITRWDHVRLVLIPLALVGAVWWTTLWCVLVAVAGTWRCCRKPTDQTVAAERGS